MLAWERTLMWVWLSCQRIGWFCEIVLVVTLWCFECLLSKPVISYTPPDVIKDFHGLFHLLRRRCVAPVWRSSQWALVKTLDKFQCYSDSKSNLQECCCLWCSWRHYEKSPGIDIVTRQIDSPCQCGHGVWDCMADWHISGPGCWVLVHLLSLLTLLECYVSKIVYWWLCDERLTMYMFLQWISGLLAVSWQRWLQHALFLKASIVSFTTMSSTLPDNY